MSDKKDFFEIGLVAGLIGGVIAGIIFAPESGSSSRQKIKNAVKNFNEQHGEEIEDAKKQLSVTCDVLKYNIERKFRILANKTRAKRMRKAKELEGDYEFN